MISPDAVWFVTGCSTGLGRAFALHIASHPSYRLVATARDVNALDYLRPYIDSQRDSGAATTTTTTTTSSRRIILLPLDVTLPSSVSAALSDTVQHFGRLDLLINNAGINTFSPAELFPEEQARDIMEVNFWGPARLTLGALSIFRDVNGQDSPGAGGDEGAERVAGDLGRPRGKKGGIIVQVSSIGGRIAMPAHAAYHASKFALEGWTEGVRSEMDPDWGVGFCVLEPGGVRSRFLGKSRLGTGVMDGEGQGEEKGRDMERERTAQAYRDNRAVKTMMEGLMSEELELGMADPEEVVRTAVEVLETTEVGRLPLRLPLGGDAVAAIEALEGVRRREFDEWKGVGGSVGVSGAEIPMAK